MSEGARHSLVDVAPIAYGFPYGVAEALPKAVGHADFGLFGIHALVYTSKPSGLEGQYLLRACGLPGVALSASMLL